jgi:hypothetical protein
MNRAIQTAVVPTAAQAKGVFTDAAGNPIALINPTTGAKYPNGVIPASDQSPFAAKVLSILQADAAPNTPVAPGGQNFTSTPANTNNANKGDARLDAYISPRSTAFARYSQSSSVVFLAPNIPGLAGGNSNGTLYAYIRARGKRRFRVATTDSRHGLPIAPNLLNRNFAVAAPNRAWTGDITYIPTHEGWLFLAVVIDLFSRRVVGWSMQPEMNSNLVIDALEMAWLRRSSDRNAGHIFHSDRGSQYASHEFRRLLLKCGITASMSRKGDCWDNASSALSNFLTATTTTNYNQYGIRILRARSVCLLEEQHLERRKADSART